MMPQVEQAFDTWYVNTITGPVIDLCVFHPAWARHKAWVVFKQHKCAGKSVRDAARAVFEDALEGQRMFL